MREVHILITKKELRARVLLIVVCLAVGLYCLYTMDKSYDPLARYPYTTDENREILLKYFDSDDIDYLVNQHISPDKFMDFVELKDFNLKNTLYYKEAKETQDADATATILIGNTDENGDYYACVKGYEEAVYLLQKSQ